MSDELEPQGSAEHGRSLRGAKNRRLVAGVVIGVIVTVFAFLNLGDVAVDWIFGTWQSPLILVIAVSFLLGMLVGWLSGRKGRSTEPPAEDLVDPR